LAKSLVEDRKLTMVGTIKKNKRTVTWVHQYQVKKPDDCHFWFSMQYHHSFICAKKKKSRFPHYILFYSKTKGGVVAVDGISGVYGTQPYHFCYIISPHQRRVKEMTADYRF
jgi:hypothetical protein